MTRRALRDRPSAPDLAKLPDDALLDRNELAALTGFATVTLKLWAKQDRGPRIARVEGRPRYRVREVRAWLEAGNG